MNSSRRNIKAGKQSKRITEKYLHNAGLYYLQRFAASSGHFREVMRRKIDLSCLHHADQDKNDCYVLLDALIVRFQDLGLLNDESYVKGMVSSLRQRGLSERAIIMKLKNRKMPESQIKDALNAFHADRGLTGHDGEIGAAMAFARKRRVGPYAAGKAFDHNKAMAAFARAGFSFDVARRILEMNEDSVTDIRADRD